MYSVPIIKLNNLFHVGSMIAGKKKAKSYEGQGLSVTTHPEAWKEIAKLDGSTWILSNNENDFLDYHALNETMKTEILTYGLARGYIRPVTNWRVTWYNHEYASYEWTDYSEELIATSDAADLDVDYHSVTIYEATDTFPDTTLSEGDTDVDMILATIWVEETQPALNGVWWSDKLSPKCLSAPRGVINLSKLSSWSRKKM